MGDPARVGEGTPPEGPPRRTGWWHGACVVWLVAVALVVLVPALRHGASFGSYDVLSQFGVLRQSGVVVHNLQAGDQSDQIIPWTTLAWTQVHHGHLPLWNPYEGLGMPLAFNWQTVAFSVPALVSYLFPLHLAYTVQVVLTLVIAGTGVYVLSRVLRLGLVASLLGATAFELSGPMLGWLGWPHAAVLSWSGWLFASVVLVLRGGRRLRHITGMALVIAAMVYAGQAEVLVLVGLAAAVFAAVLLVRRTAWSGGSGPLLQPALDLVFGVAAGAALGAPLLLPGLQVIAGSERGAPGGDPGEILKGNPALPVHNLTHLVFQGFDGLPIVGSHWFGYVGGYSETASYVGVIVLVLAALAVATRFHRPEVLALAVMTVVLGVVAFVPPVVAVLGRLPVVGTLLWQRGILPMAFGLAVLSGVGLDVLVREHHKPVVRRWAIGGFLAAAGVLIILWIVGRGHLSSSDAAIRDRSFWWPAVQVVVGLLVTGALGWVDRRGVPKQAVPWRPRSGQMAAGVLFVCETLFLVASGASLWTAASTPFAPTPAEAALKATVGSSVVGLGASFCFLSPGLGVPENAQLPYGVQELAIYDPMIPSAYYSSWRSVSSASPGLVSDSVYCPGLDTARLARLYGVSYVVDRRGSPGPAGGVFVRTVGDEDLYRIPGSSVATLVPASPSGADPADDAVGTPVAVIHPDPASWSLTTDADHAQVLRLRLTDVPGWHATVDGKAVPLRPFADVMLQLDVPGGRHVVTLNYWPSRFTAGIVLAAGALAALGGAGLIGTVRRRRRQGPSDPGQSPSG